jgi:hypothetical protein
MGATISTTLGGFVHNPVLPIGTTGLVRNWFFAADMGDDEPDVFTCENIKMPIGTHDDRKYNFSGYFSNILTHDEQNKKWYFRYCGKTLLGSDYFEFSHARGKQTDWKYIKIRNLTVSDLGMARAVSRE